MSAAPTGPAELAAALSGRYRIEREIGRGGMAVVYLADDVRYGRPVAIKVMHPRLTAAIGRDRFLREIEIAARLTHPHIVPLHDSGTAAGQLYYVMPYIAGESLRARLVLEKQLPLEEALRLTREIASALGHAHHRGLIHRDVKPENVLLSDGIALVTDFGIARAMRSSTPGEGNAEGMPTQVTLTGPGMIIGTPRYMAPEQAVGGTVDARSDLYALACVLYEMLAGVPPFTEPAMETLVRQLLTDVPAPVTVHRASIPAAVAAVIAQGLAKSPGDRHPTMARFAEALAGAARGEATPAPVPAATGVATAHNLPRQRTRLIGRGPELAQCASRLNETRLLSITAIGGCGKTRLALEVAQGQLPNFPDGVWFVDLAPVVDAERVVQATAIVLGVRERPGVPLIETLAEELSGRCTLIVLDNCEHVRERAAELADRLLAATSDLKLVVTSRESLGVEGESTFSLESLPVPEAVQLFCDRARVVDARFEPSEPTRAAIAEICRRLDGIPLAVELAAARVKMLTAEQILARLDDRFRLLSAGSTALPRHQTLRATIQWSYDQLSEEDQRFFRQLAVFAGGWTLEGATRVAAAEADEFTVLDAITRLADKSLVGMDREGGEARYTMLETVRQFALERLVETGEGDEARARHLDFFVALAEEAAPELLGPQQRAWLQRLDRERENLLLAHAACDRPDGGAERGLRLVSSLTRYWVSCGLLPLGYRVAGAALSRAGAQERSRARCLALVAAGQLGFFMGQYDQAQAYLEESLTIAREYEDTVPIISALRALGTVSMAQKNMARAREHMEEALSLARLDGDRIRLAIALSHLAELDRAEGELETAERRYEESLAVCRELGNHDNIAINLLNLALLAVGRGAGARARVLLREALAIAEEIGSRYSGQAVLEVASGLATSIGDWERAARFDGASEAQRELMGVRREPPDEAFFEPLLAQAREALGRAAVDDAKSAGRALSYEAAIAEARPWLEAEG